MKRIIITERQYKRLVNLPLNEQNVGGGEIKFSEGYSENDIKGNRVWKFLNVLREKLWEKYNKNLFIIEVGDTLGFNLRYDYLIVDLDLDKYTKKENRYIKKLTKEETGSPGSIFYNIKYGYIYFPLTDSEFENDQTDDNDQTGDNEVTDGSEESKYSIDFGDLEQGDIDLEDEPYGSLSSEIPTELHDLMYLVSSEESMGHSYNSANPSKIIDGLSDMTIEEAKAANGSSAVGRWQFMPEYIESFATRAGLKMTDKFNQTNQDKMAMQFIPGWKNWSCKKLGQKIATTWAAMPVLYDQHRPKYKNIPARELVRGESYYEGVSSNTAGVTADKFETALRKTGCNVSSDKSNSEDETVTVKDVPNIPFRNKTEGNAFRKWVNDNHKEYAEEIDLSETGDWKKGQKNFKGFMLKAWNEHGKKYIDDGGYKELEDIETSNGGCKLSKCQFRTKNGCKTFDELTPDSNMGTYRSGGNFFPIPDDNNNFRSGALRAEQMLYALETYDIKKIISFDDGEDNTLEMKNSEEEKFIECYNKSKGTNVEWIKISAHIDPYKVGEGYVGTLNKVLPLIKDGNTLIHCTHGADRTGYVVAKHLKDLGKIGTNEDLWNYTIKFNSWAGAGGYICNPKKGNNGFIKYLEGFYPHKEWCKVGNRMKDCQSCKKYK